MMGNVHPLQDDKQGLHEVQMMRLESLVYFLFLFFYFTD